MKQLETEIKFYLPDLPAMRQHILNLGAESRGRFFESNLLNYLHIFEILQNNLNLNFSDLTFDNFKHVAVDLNDYLEQLVAGD